MWIKGTFMWKDLYDKRVLPIFAKTFGFSPMIFAKIFVSFCESMCKTGQVWARQHKNYLWIWSLRLKQREFCDFRRNEIYRMIFAKTKYLRKRNIREVLFSSPLTWGVSGSPCRCAAHRPAPADCPRWRARTPALRFRTRPVCGENCSLSDPGGIGASANGSQDPQISSPKKILIKPVPGTT